MEEVAVEIHENEDDDDDEDEDEEDEDEDEEEEEEGEREDAEEDFGDERIGEEDNEEREDTIIDIRPLDLNFDPISYAPCPSIDEQQLQFIKLLAYAVLKMTRKHNDVLLDEDVPDNVEAIFHTNRPGETYHRLAQIQLQQCSTKRDKLIEYAIIVQENEKYKHLIRDTKATNPQYYKATKQQARELLNGCLTQEQHDKNKAAATIATIAQQKRKEQERREWEENDLPLLAFLKGKGIVAPDITKLCKYHLVDFFRREQKRVGKKKVKIESELDALEYRFKMEDYINNNTNDVCNPNVVLPPLEEQ